MVERPSNGWGGVGRAAAAEVAKRVWGYGSGSGVARPTPLQVIDSAIETGYKLVPSSALHLLALMPTMFRSLSKLIGPYLDELPGGVLKSRCAHASSHRRSRSGCTGRVS